MVNPKRAQVNLKVRAVMKGRIKLLKLQMNCCKKYTIIFLSWANGTQIFKIKSLLNLVFGKYNVAKMGRCS